MWSVVEKTALAEAEVEYEEHVSDTVYVAFPVTRDKSAFGPLASGGPGAAKAALDQMQAAAIVIWTTTPWTIPGNRAIAMSRRISYGLYSVKTAPSENWAKPGATYVVADKLAAEFFRSAKVEEFELLRRVSADELANVVCRHPLSALGYGFDVPLLEGDYVTDDAGTGFVHTAPGHGREDFDLWMANGQALTARGIETRIPYTVDENGAYTADAPGFEGKRVITDKGEPGDANEAVIKALIEAKALVARGKLKHQYPHSWRSKKPVIFRNTPQWFIAMDKDIADPHPTPSGSTSPPRGEV
jgi:isoleucyl-tRNA synthetase